MMIGSAREEGSHCRKSLERGFFSYVLKAENEIERTGLFYQIKRNKPKMLHSETKKTEKTQRRRDKKKKERDE